MESKNVHLIEVKEQRWFLEFGVVDGKMSTCWPKGASLQSGEINVKKPVVQQGTIIKDFNTAFFSM